VVEQQYLVAVDDRVQSVRDRQHCRLSKVVIYQGLNLFFGDYVDVGSCFVKDHDFVLPQYCPADAD
jgi:hypothetical protein